MKTKILSLFLICMFFVAYSQQSIIKLYLQIKPTSLPFYSSNGDKSYGGENNNWMNYWEWDYINTNMWNDLGLISPISEGEEGLESCSIANTFIPTNGDYKLMAVHMGLYDFGKRMLITLNNNGKNIDAIDVAAGVTIRSNNNPEIAFPMQWSLSTDMKVTVYQLKPTSTKPLIYGPDITFPLQAQRIDKVYQISSTGKFTLISTKLYHPKSYQLSSFIDKDYAIRLGGETPIQ